MNSLKIISWNVNGIRAAQKKGLLEYIAQEKPDIFCVQETKAHPEQLDEALANPEGYHVTYHSCSIKKGYSGVATFSVEKPHNTELRFGVEKFDCEGRVVQSDFGDFVVLNVYFPNGGMEHRLPYKLEFYDAFFAYCETLRKQGRKLIICGDYNTAHHEIDLARPKQNTTTSGFMPIEREKIDDIVALGYVDTFREFTGDPEHYTWWSNQQRSRERNVGWRIDYHFVTKDLLPRVTASYHQPHVMGSDHCPVVLELAG